VPDSAGKSYSLTFPVVFYPFTYNYWLEVYLTSQVGSARG